MITEVTRISAIDYIEPSDLVPGEIFKRFRNGSRVVCLRKDPRHTMLIAALFKQAGLAAEFWKANLFDLARNHAPGETNLGDVVRFVPGEFGHLARKYAFYPDPNTGKFVVSPTFVGKHSHWTLPSQEVLQLAWELAIDVYRSSTDKPVDPQDYAVKLELLKYPDSSDDLLRVFGLIADSASRWSRIGKQLDHAAATACGPFGNRYLKHLYAIVSMIPGFGHLARKLNLRYGHSRYHAHSNDKMLVGPPHTDGDRYITMLSGERKQMITEVFAGGSWEKMPVEPDSLSIFPTRVYEKSVGARATIHRYLIERVRQSDSTTDSRNVTVLIGVMRRAKLDP